MVVVAGVPNTDGAEVGTGGVLTLKDVPNVNPAAGLGVEVVVVVLVVIDGANTNPVPTGAVVDALAVGLAGGVPKVNPLNALPAVAALEEEATLPPNTNPDGPIDPADTVAVAGFGREAA